MNIHLLAVGKRMPDWVNQGFQEYVKRLPKECRLHLREIAAAKRTNNSSVEQLREQEAKLISAAIPKGSQIIVLDEHGQAWDTATLAKRLAEWQMDGRDISLIVGGADGIASMINEIAAHQWSLSPLTLPHPMVRIVIAEQLYRAWSILNNHPYHRA